MIAGGASAFSPADDANTRKVAPTGFEENRGQVRTTGGEPAPHVRFRLEQNGASIFLLDNGIAYQFNRALYPEGYDELGPDPSRDPRTLALNAHGHLIRQPHLRLSFVPEEDAARESQMRTTGVARDIY